MAHVVELPPAQVESLHRADRLTPAIRTSEVYVVFTSVGDTLGAVRFAHELAQALGVALTLIHFRSVPYPLDVEAPAGISPAETETFIERLRAEGIDIRVRVYLCRNERRAIPFAFRPHSLIVLGGRPGWRPTRSERWRRMLEAAGHFVVFVDTSATRAGASHEKGAV